MFKRTIIGIISFFLIGSFAVAQQNITLKTPSDSLSYALGMSYGMNITSNLGQYSIAFSPEIIMKALNDVFKNQPTLLNEKQMQEILMALQQDMMAKRDKKTKESGEANIKKGADFLAENKKKEGVQTLPDGLQYKVITMGKGRKPTTENEVKVHYTGKLIDGKVFDSSVDRGQPITFPVTGVIKGWTEALQLMPEGSKWMLFIPSDLAYGDKGAGQVIGSNETLIFEVELLEVIDKDKKDAAPAPVDAPKNAKKVDKPAKKK